MKHTKSGNLVIGRKVGDTVIVNDNIEVTLLEINGNQVKLGFKAPREVSVWREELYRKMEKQKLLDMMD